MKHFLFVVACTFIAVGCGDGGAGGGTDAPEVVSTSPSDGQSGVQSGAVIEITFSEAMDQLATQQAFASSDFPSDQVMFGWNVGGTVLTITPAAALVYAEGQDPSVVDARSYSYTLGAGAQDLDGNSLTPVTVTFTTLRRIQTEFGIVVDDDLQGDWRSNGMRWCSNGGSASCIGDADDNTYGRAFSTFDLGSVPQTASAVESATFYVSFDSDSVTDEYPLGALLLEHVQFESIGSIAFGASALSDLGELIPVGTSSNDLLAERGLSVTEAVADDLDNRAQRSNRSQYRLTFDDTTNFDGSSDAVSIAIDSARLEVDYLTP